jgi:hypothetical protein
MKFSAQVKRFQIVLPAGYINLISSSPVKVGAVQAGLCVVATSKVASDTVDCTLSESAPAGTQIDAFFETGVVNPDKSTGFARIPPGAGASAHAAEPAVGKPFALLGP